MILTPTFPLLSLAGVACGSIAGRGSFIRGPEMVSTGLRCCTIHAADAGLAALNSPAFCNCQRAASQGGLVPACRQLTPIGKRQASEKLTPRQHNLGLVDFAPAVQHRPCLGGSMSVNRRIITGRGFDSRQVHIAQVSPAWAVVTRCLTRIAPTTGAHWCQRPTPPLTGAGPLTFITRLVAGDLLGGGCVSAAAPERPKRKK
jgi:hypothetical protein